MHIFRICSTYAQRCAKDIHHPSANSAASPQKKFTLNADNVIILLCVKSELPNGNKH